MKSVQGWALVSWFADLALWVEHRSLGCCCRKLGGLGRWFLVVQWSLLGPSWLGSRSGINERKRLPGEYNRPLEYEQTNHLFFAHTHNHQHVSHQWKLRPLHIAFITRITISGHDHGHYRYPLIHKQYFSFRTIRTIHFYHSNYRITLSHNHRRALTIINAVSLLYASLSPVFRFLCMSLSATLAYTCLSTFPLEVSTK